MISVVICTHNGASRLHACISALINQNNPPKYEIILVDNASTDETVLRAKEELQKSKPDVSWKLVKEEKPGLVYARFAGLKAAVYEWVLFCDDDNVLFYDFLSKSENILLNSPELGVLGSKGVPEFLGTKPEWFDQYASSYAVGGQNVIPTTRNPLVHVYGACSFYRKTPMLNLLDSGFSPGLQGRKGRKMSAGDDVEWCWLMQLMGYQIDHCPELKFYHVLPAKRLTWDYYKRLKIGISGSAGLLYAYIFFVREPSKPWFEFAVHYLARTIKASFLYGKYCIRWLGNPKQRKDQLSFVILKAQLTAFLSHSRISLAHYKQLKKYFGT